MGISSVRHLHGHDWRRVAADAVRVLLLAAASAAYYLRGRTPAPPLVPALVILVFVVVLFGWLARRDPAGFASIAVPPLLLCAAAIPLGDDARRTASVLGMGWVGLLLCADRWFWRHWSRHVLRRDLPSRQRTFERELIVPVRSCMAALGLLPGSMGSDARLSIAAARSALAGLHAPDADWLSLQQDLEAVMDEILADDDGPISAADLPDDILARLEDLPNRLSALRLREPEWRGLRPVFAPGDESATS
jgi:hypothetical protein